MKTIDLNPDTIIWSADTDVTTVLDAMNRELLPKGTIIKLDRLFFEKYPDKSFIRLCQEKGYPVFVDAKIIDEPEKVLGIAATYLQYRPFMLSIMADSFSTGIWRHGTNLDTLRRFAESCANVNCKSCAVLMLPSKTAAACWNLYGAEPLMQMREYATAAVNSGITDVLCSTEEAADIKGDDYFDDLKINVTGLAMPERIGEVDDEGMASVSTPAKAMSIGADRLVIGEDLTDGNMKKNYTKIAKHVLESIVAA